MAKPEVWCGFQHHFICECRFHLATFVGPWLISTVGDYQHNGKRDTIGSGRTFETFVFHTDGINHRDEGHPTVDDWSEKDSEVYMDEVAAVRGHGRMLAKYRKRVEG